MSAHPYLPKSERLYFLQPKDVVLMQQLWKVMDDMQNGFITLGEAIDIINSFPTMPAGVRKGDIIVFDGTNFVIKASGLDGTVLTADSTQSDGLRYTTIETLSPFLLMGG